MMKVKPVKLGKTERMSFSHIDEVISMPNLIEVQKNSYQWFLDEGLKEVFHDIGTIEDYTGNLALSFVDFRKNLMKGNYFGTMLVKMGEADCLLGGATYSTADTVRPALQLIKTKPGNSNVSSCFILQREKDGVDERLCMGDCAIQIDPDEDALVETALECAKTAATFGIDPKIAFLSYSTKGSGKGDAVDKVKNACDKAKAAAPELAIDGEMQFDAAVSPVVGQQKFPGSKVAGHANTFIFPEIQSGNIGYKIAQRLGGFAAYGPILQGLNAPINDLSRGCDADEVYKMAIITAALA